MKHLLVFSLICFVWWSAKAQDQKFFAESGLSVAHSNFDWSIAGNSKGESPNILSELRFNSITSLGYFIRSAYKPSPHLAIVVYYQKNETFSGTGTDIDYQNDNRSSPTENLEFSSDQGGLQILKAGVKSQILRRGRLAMDAGILYQSNIQNFYILSAEVPDLQSTYKAKTSGVEIGTDARFTVCRILSTLLIVNAGYVNYRAEGNWNLREIFMHPLSFSQASKGLTMGGGLGIAVRITPALNLTVSGNYSYTKIYQGTDTSYLVSGPEVITRFNGGSNNLLQAEVGISLRL